MSVRMGAPGVAVSPTSMAFRSTRPVSGDTRRVSARRAWASASAECASATWARAATTASGGGLGVGEAHEQLAALDGLALGHGALDDAGGDLGAHVHLQGLDRAGDRDGAVLAIETTDGPGRGEDQQQDERAGAAELQAPRH